MNYEDMFDLLLRSDYTSYLNTALLDQPSNEAYHDLQHLKEKIENYRLTSNTAQSQSDLNYINLFAIELIAKHAKSLTSNNTLQLSPKQYAFCAELTKLIVIAQNWSLAYNDVNFIDQVNNKFASILSLKDANLTDISNLYSQPKQEELDEFKTKIRRKAMKDASFQNIHGIDEIRDNFRALLDDVKVSEEALVIALVGPPGTGKSTLSHCFAHEYSEGIYYNFGGMELSAGVVGVTERGMKELFDETEQNPGTKYTIVMDEFDRIFTTTQAHFNTVQGTIQTELSGARQMGTNVVIICLTNHYDRIPAEIQRRINTKIYVPLPSKGAVLDYFYFLLKVKRQHVKQDFDNRIEQLLVDKNVSNGNIKTWVNRVRSKGMRKEKFTLSNSEDFGFPDIIYEVNYNVMSNYKSKGVEANKKYVLDLNRELTSKRLVILPDFEVWEDILNEIKMLSNEQLARFEQANR